MQGSKNIWNLRWCAALLLFCFLLLPARPVRADSVPSKITLDKTSATVLKGKSFTLKAKITPASAANAAVAWVSSNEKVATVSQKGKVKIVGVGTARITAKTVDGKRPPAR